MASNRKSRIPSTQRDIVTCEPLQRGTGRIALTDRDMRRHPLHRTPIPFRLHVSQQETVERDGTECDLSERLGSHALAKPMIHYISEGERSQRRQEKEWWNDHYVCGRLAAIAGPKPAPFTPEQLMLALAYERGQDLADSGYTHRFISFAVICVARVAKTYMPRIERMAA